MLSVQETQSLRISLQVIAKKHPIKQLTELSDDEQETDTDEFFYKLEEVSTVQARGKQLYTSLEFADPNATLQDEIGLSARYRSDIIMC